MHIGLGKPVPFHLGPADRLRVGAMRLLVLLLNRVPGVERLLSWASLRTEAARRPAGAGCPFVKAAGSHATVAMPAHAHAAASGRRVCCPSPLAVTILALLASTAVLAAAALLALCLAAARLVLLAQHA